MLLSYGALLLVGKFQEVHINERNSQAARDNLSIEDALVVRKNQRIKVKLL
jgi:hypothetical protein